MFHWIQDAVTSVTGLLRLQSEPADLTQRSYVERYTLPPQALSEKQVAEVAHTQATVRSQISGQEPLEYIRDTLKKCTWPAHVLNLRDVAGYNLLQAAIIADRPDIVRFLIGQGADLNSPMCGRPLHLAAKLGHQTVLETLLTYGADPDVMACVCYPDPHHGDAKLVYNSITRGWGTCCPGDVYSDMASSTIDFNYPLFYAIQSDDVMSVQLLMSKNGRQLKDSASPLNIACCTGAYKCASYFIASGPSRCSLVDCSGRVPLQCCLNQNKSFIELLLQDGADLMIKTKSEETLLHLLFKERECFTGMSDMCVYLLDCGLQINVHALDENGDSALNVCLQRVSQGNTDKSLPPTSEDEMKEVITCVSSLLDKKANPNIANKAGNTSLHILAQMAAQDSDQLLPQKLQLIQTLLALLLTNKANPNLVNNSKKKALDLFIEHVPPVLYGLVKNPGYLDFASLQEGTEKFVGCLQLLSESGCCFSSMQYKNTYCHLEKILHYLRFIPSSSLGDGAGQVDLTLTFRIKQLVQSISSVTECLLTCGCSLTSCACRDTHLDYVFHALFKVEVPSFVLRDFLHLLLSHGAVINTQGLPVSFDGVIACDVSHAPLVRILRTTTSREEEDVQSDQVLSISTKEHLVKLFCDCMDPSQLRSCFSLFQGNPYKMDFVAENAFLKNFTAPLPLKTICARVIYKALQGKLYHIKAMHLPAIIKTYLCDLDY